MNERMALLDRLFSDVNEIYEKVDNGELSVNEAWLILEERGVGY